MQITLNSYFFPVLQNESTKSLRVQTLTSTHVARIKETSFHEGKSRVVGNGGTNSWCSNVVVEAKTCKSSYEGANDFFSPFFSFSFFLSLFLSGLLLLREAECKSSDWEHFRNVFEEKEMRMTMVVQLSRVRFDEMNMKWRKSVLVFC